MSITVPMTWLELVALFAMTLIVSLAGTRGVLAYLRRRAILDHPNERSSHARPTPRGGGLAVAAVMIGAWVLVGARDSTDPGGVWIVCAVAFALAALSWMDDLRGLPVHWRLIGQISAVAVTLSMVDLPGPFFAGLLSPTLDIVAAGIMWVWFINLFNFMDGIDGITGIESACIGAGVVLIAVITGTPGPMAPLGLAVTATALGFLWWNWQPARIFLGDVGSISLGFFLGWLLLTVSASGQWAAALILPSYYLADATITLVRRLLRSERIWHAHREHFYQRAVQRGLSHGAVAGIVLLANLILIAFAGLAATGRAWPALVGACIVVTILLLFLESGSVRGKRWRRP
jgi:UDP-N-acetylmuramyl pentapeptide phosphotransferase/UDP-N-acetylglucosamine-1-phosphate transferase